jgi:hypothetical protein
MFEEWLGWVGWFVESMIRDFVSNTEEEEE